MRRSVCLVALFAAAWPAFAAAAPPDLSGRWLPVPARSTSTNAGRAPSGCGSIRGGARACANTRSRPVPDGPTDPLPSAMGTSVGHWEGDTLVVETTNVRKDGFGRFSGNPPVSNARRFVERISLGRDEEGRKQLRNEITIHDAAVLARPVTLRMLYKWSPDMEVGKCRGARQAGAVAGYSGICALRVHTLPLANVMRARYMKCGFLLSG